VVESFCGDAHASIGILARLAFSAGEVIFTTVAILLLRRGACRVEWLIFCAPLLKISGSGGKSKEQGGKTKAEILLLNEKHQTIYTN